MSIMETVRRYAEPKREKPSRLKGAVKIVALLFTGVACVVTIDNDARYYSEILSVTEPPPFNECYLDNSLLGEWTVVAKPGMNKTRGMIVNSALSQKIVFDANGRYHVDKTWLASRSGRWYCYSDGVSQYLYFEPDGASIIYYSRFYAFPVRGVFIWGHFRFAAPIPAGALPPPRPVPPVNGTPSTGQTTHAIKPASNTSAPSPSRTPHAIRPEPNAVSDDASHTAVVLPGSNVDRSIPATIQGVWSRTEVLGDYEYLIVVRIYARNIQIIDPIRGNVNRVAFIRNGRLIVRERSGERAISYSLAANSRQLVFDGKRFKKGLVRAPGKRRVSPPPVAAVDSGATSVPTPAQPVRKEILPPQLRGTWSVLVTVNGKIRRDIYRFTSTRYTYQNSNNVKRSGKAWIQGNTLVLVMNGKPVAYPLTLDPKRKWVRLGETDFRKGVVNIPKAVTHAKPNKPTVDPVAQVTPPAQTQRPVNGKNGKPHKVKTPPRPKLAHDPIPKSAQGVWSALFTQGKRTYRVVYRFSAHEYQRDDDLTGRTRGAAWLDRRKLVMVENGKERMVNLVIDRNRKWIRINTTKYMKGIVKIPTPKPVVTPTPAPKPVVKPTPAPKPVVKPTPAPKPVVKPTPAPKPVVKPTPAPKPVAEKPIPVPANLKNGVPGNVEGVWSEIVRKPNGTLLGLREIRFTHGKYKFSSPVETAKRGRVRYNETFIVLDVKGGRPLVLRYSVSKNRKTLTLGNWHLTRGSLKMPKK